MPSVKNLMQNLLPSKSRREIIIKENEAIVEDLERARGRQQSAFSVFMQEYEGRQSSNKVDSRLLEDKPETEEVSPIVPDSYVFSPSIPGSPSYYQSPSSPTRLVPRNIDSKQKSRPIGRYERKHRIKDSKSGEKIPR